MRLSYQIPLLTGITLILTIGVNIFAFRYFVSDLFPEYLSQISLGETDNPNPEKIEALLKVGKLDTGAQDDYKKVLNELSNLSTSLQNIAENPKLYISTSGAEISDGGFSILLQSWSSISRAKGIVNILINPTNLDSSSPEWVFILKLLYRILWVNLVWLILILITYFLWIRKIFSPVNLIINQLKQFIDTAEYSSIRYSRNDEFFPLISTINNLHRSLSIQENIRSNFLSDLSHEIRTPITAVKLYLEGIEDGMIALNSKTIPLIQSELSRLAQTTGKIMEYESLAQSILNDAHVERFQAKKLLSEIIATYKPQLAKNNQQIILDMGTDSMTLMDKWMLAQIVHNIFSNFLKYAGKNTILTCRYIKTETYYIFQFADNGIGIPDDEIPLVKEKFYRVDKSRTSQGETSMGIGLSIVERIARLHNGKLEIQKNTPSGVVIQISIKR